MFRTRLDFDFQIYEGGVDGKKAPSPRGKTLGFPRKQGTVVKMRTRKIAIPGGDHKKKKRPGRSLNSSAKSTRQPSRHTEFEKGERQVKGRDEQNRGVLKTSFKQKISF